MHFNNTRSIYGALFLVSVLLSACGGGGTASVGGGATAPAAPTGVVADCGNNRITVSWSAVTGAASYDVYRSTVASATGALLGSSATTSYIDTSGTVGTTYYYKVKAVNSAGASIASAEVSETFYTLLAGSMQGKSLPLTGNVTTFAGSSGFSGFIDDVGSTARFSLPQGMTTDGTYLYVADYLNNAIRKIDPATQTVSTFAGSTTGVGGSTDGVGTAARFFRPYDITSDGTNLYVTDYNNCTIRKIVIASAVVTTLAGTVGSCSPLTDGIGSAAVLVSPQGITTDGTSLFVTENTAVRRIDIASQTVSTFAGSTAGVVGHVDATATAARFNNLEGITTDGTSLYVVDRYYQDIRKIDIASAAVSSFAGDYTNVTTTTSADGTGTGATFYVPSGITTDGTNLYVLEYWGDVVRKVGIASATVSTLAGLSGSTGTADGTGANARFSSPMGITTYCGNLFIGDTGNSSIRQIK